MGRATGPTRQLRPSTSTAATQPAAEPVDAVWSAKLVTPDQLVAGSEQPFVIEVTGHGTPPGEIVAVRIGHASEVVRPARWDGDRLVTSFPTLAGGAYRLRVKLRTGHGLVILDAGVLVVRS